ncbi:hypothetical protein [Pseudactinotalea sp. Z1748]|uniref:hypothetical protein n=1 Tax=Pseudactinotalea sp. Z1748 TaxID=3413027 RepID=UPI003C7A46F2
MRSTPPVWGAGMTLDLLPVMPLRDTPATRATVLVLDSAHVDHGYFARSLSVAAPDAAPRALAGMGLLPLAPERVDTEEAVQT